MPRRDATSLIGNQESGVLGGAQQVKVVQVVVPQDATPGQTLQIQVDNTLMNVVVPANAMPGSNLSIEVPVNPVAPQPAVVPGTPLPQQQVMQQHPVAAASPAVATGRIGDRRTVPDGATALCQPNAITLSSWEVKDASLCKKISLALRCSVADTSRAYIYIRDNHSLELNDTMSISSFCTCCCPFQDSIRVEYFDRAPWMATCTIAPFPWCCCVTFVSAAALPLTPVRAGKSVRAPTTDVSAPLAIRLPTQGQPKLEVVDLSCLCCCMKIDPCCHGKRVVYMPSEEMPFPCCCCPNRVNCCDNCCGCCGPVTGNPKIFSIFSPQPKDAIGFVNAAQAAMRRGGSPESMHIER